MNTTTAQEKVKQLVETQFTYDDCKTAFAVPGESNIVDLIHPVTGLSLHYGQSLDDMRQRYANVEIVVLSDWIAAKAARQDLPPTWAEVTEERYWEMLECLPPACQMGGGFLVGEAWDHHAGNGQPRYAAFISRGKKYLEASRPLTIAEFRALYVNKSAHVAATV